MIWVPGTSLELPAVEIEKRKTENEDSWWDRKWITIQLRANVEALRVHVGAGKGAAATEAHTHLIKGAGFHGPWYAIGDFIQTYRDYIATRSLPWTPTRFGPLSFFTKAVLVTFLPGTILNVGRASELRFDRGGRLFGYHPGGGEQAEFLEGPQPHIEQLRGLWGRKMGHT